MSDETTMITIETIKKKLKKYTALKEHEKVKEYLRKLHKISFTATIIRETKIHTLIRQIASNKTATYNSSAKHLLKRWHYKKLLRKSTKLRSAPNQNLTIVENKSNNNNRRNSDEISESQSSDDNKKRKVLSLAQYLENKKHILSPSSAINLTQKKLTDIQIQIINEQFKATTEKLTATVSDLSSIADKSLAEVEKININKINPVPKRSIIEQQITKCHDFWAEDDDDDDGFNTSLQKSNQKQ